MPFIDPYNLSIETEDFLTVSLVSFKAGDAMAWLTKALKMPGGRWWRYHQNRFPLLLEITQLIRDKKVTKGCAGRMPRNHKSLLPLQVRGKVLWFQNDSRFVTLAIRDGKGEDEADAFAYVHWFLQELSKDFESPAFKEAPVEEPAEHKGVRAPVPEDLQDIVTETLKTLTEHHPCLSARYFHSRLSIRVQRRNDKVSQDFRVKGLKRKRDEAAEQDSQDLIKRQFDLAVQSAISFLDSEAPAEDADSSHQAQGLAAEPAAEEDEDQE